MKLRRTALVVLLLAHAAPVGAQVDPIRLEGLVVTGSPTPRPFDVVSSHVTVLEGDELRALGLTRVQDALRSVPGVDVVQSGSFGAVTSVFMRGGESDYVLVLVDGVQVNQPGGAFDFSSLVLDDVERIEVVRGPSSALYGSDAVAGVVHVVTRTGSGALRGVLSARGGSYGRRDVSLGVSGSSDRASYALTLTRNATDGILDVNNGHRNAVLAGTMRFRPDAATTGKLTVRLTDREYRYPTDGSGGVDDLNALTFEDVAVVGISLARRLSHRLDLQALLGVHELDGGTDDAPDGPADTLGFFGFTSLDHVRRTNADLRANLRVAGGVLTLGGELEEERQRSFTESLSQFGPSSGRSEYARWNRAAYVHVSRDAGRLAVDAGARLEDNERFGRLGTWEVGASFALSGDIRVRGALGRGIKEPTFFENYATGFAVGNPDLDPERSRSWEVGLEQSLADGRGRLSVTWFDQVFRDLIQYTSSPPAPSDPNFFNVAAAAARGLEVAVNGRMGSWNGGASWTWLDSEVQDAGFDAGPGATFVAGGRLLRRPERSGSARLGYVRGPGSVSLEVQHVGEREDRDFATFPAGEVVLPAHTLVSLGAGLEVRDGLAFTLRAENLTDRSYEEVFGYDAPGRALYVGARLTLGGGS